MKLNQIFTGNLTEVDYHGSKVTTGIYKTRVPKQPVKVTALGLEGDKQADLTVHGGINKAVYVYPSEHYNFWKNARQDLEFENGVFGENLSVEGMFEENIYVGDKFSIGNCLFEVTTPRLPCFKLGIKMGDPTMIKDFMAANKTGFYFKVLEEGEVEEGSEITKTGDDGYQLSIPELVSLYSTEKHNTHLLEKAIGSPSLQEDWVTFFKERLTQTNS